jgi:molybdopterin synthase sulfur carrier subunit
MLTVKFFARLREALGPQTQWPYSPGLTVGALRDALVAQGGVHAGALDRSQFLRAARNQRMVDETEPLADGDEVAFFPPVTGG